MWGCYESMIQGKSILWYVGLLCSKPKSNQKWRLWFHSLRDLTGGGFAWPKFVRAYCANFSKAARKGRVFKRIMFEYSHWISVGSVRGILKCLKGEKYRKKRFSFVLFVPFLRVNVEWPLTNISRYYWFITVMKSRRCAGRKPIPLECGIQPRAVHRARWRGSWWHLIVPPLQACCSATRGGVPAGASHPGHFGTESIPLWKKMTYIFKYNIFPNQELHLGPK